MAKNWHIQSNISGYSGLIFTVFSPYESALSADDIPVPCFPICWGTLPWQSIDFGKMSWMLTDTTCILCTTVLFKNELQCHCLNVHTNSGDDVAISCNNLVNFCRVTTEIMELIWERQVWNGQKTGVFCWISADIVDGFSQYFYHMKALYVQMMICTYFPICQGTLPWQPNNVATMKANWYYVHCLHVCQMVARFWFATIC